jgi:hypothetical protein
MKAILIPPPARLLHYVELLVFDGMLVLPSWTDIDPPEEFIWALIKSPKLKFAAEPGSAHATNIMTMGNAA